MEDLSNKEMFTLLINELQKVSNSVSSLSSRMDNLESSKSIHSMNSSKLKESNLDLSVDDDNNFKSFNDDTNEVQNLYRVAIKPDGLCGVHSINKMIVNNKDKEVKVKGVKQILELLYSLVESAPEEHLKYVLDMDELVDETNVRPLEEYLEQYRKRLFQPETNYDKWLNLYEVGLVNHYLKFNLVVLIMDNDSRVVDYKMFISDKHKLLNMMLFKNNHFDIVYGEQVINLIQLPKIFNVVDYHGSAKLTDTKAFVKLNLGGKFKDIKNTYIYKDAQVLVHVNDITKKTSDRRRSLEKASAFPNDSLVGSHQFYDKSFVDFKKVKNRKPSKGTYDGVRGNPIDPSDSSDSSDSSSKSSKESRSNSTITTVRSFRKKATKTRSSRSKSKSDGSSSTQNIVIRDKFKPEDHNLVLKLNQGQLTLAMVAQWYGRFQLFSKDPLNEGIKLFMVSCIDIATRDYLVARNINCYQILDDYKDLTKVPNMLEYPRNKEEYAAYLGRNDEEVFKSIMRSVIQTSRGSLVSYINSIQVVPDDKVQDGVTFDSSFNLSVYNFDAMLRVILSYMSRIVAIMELVSKYAADEVKLPVFENKRSDGYGKTYGIVNIMAKKLTNVGVRFLQYEIENLSSLDEQKLRNLSLNEFYTRCTQRLSYFSDLFKEVRIFMDNQRIFRSVDMVRLREAASAVKSLNSGSGLNLVIGNGEENNYDQDFTESVENLDEVVEDNSNLLLATTDSTKNGIPIRPSVGQVGNYGTKSKNEEYRPSGSKVKGPCVKLDNCPFFKSGNADSCVYSHDPKILSDYVKKLQDHIQAVTKPISKMSQAQSKLELLFQIVQKSGNEELLDHIIANKDMLMEVLVEGSKLSPAYIEGSILDNSKPEGRQE